jgi:hypothetical protein
MDKDFLTISGVEIDPDIVGVKFVCDVARCKGACCTIESDLGAPLLESEIGEIEKALPAVKEYLPHDHALEIHEKGCWEERRGTYRTRCLNRRDCVFVYYDGDIARCGIERVYREGSIDFMKPLSCHLFPLRVWNFNEPIVRYELYHECKPALVKGIEEGVSLVQFCQDALGRAFGEDWLRRMRRELVC